MDFGKTVVSPITVVVRNNASSFTLLEITDLECRDFAPYDIHSHTQPKLNNNVLYFRFITNTPTTQSFNASHECYYSKTKSDPYPGRQTSHYVEFTPLTGIMCNITSLLNVTIFRRDDTTVPHKFLLFDNIYPSTTSIEMPTLLILDPYEKSLTVPSFLYSQNVNMLVELTNTNNASICVSTLSMEGYPVCLYNAYPVLGNKANGTYWYSTTLQDHSGEPRAIDLYFGNISSLQVPPYNTSYSSTLFKPTVPSEIAIINQGPLTDLFMLIEINSGVYSSSPKSSFFTSFISELREYNQEVLLPPFPFGYGSGTMASFNFTATYLISQYTRSTRYSLIYYERLDLIFNSVSVIDETQPWIVSIKVTPLDTYRNIIKLVVQDDLSGVYQVAINTNQYITTEADIVHTDTSSVPAMITYEIVFETPMLFNYLDVKDFARNEVSFSIPSYLPYSMEPMPLINYPLDWILSDITFFTFAFNRVNVTNTPSTNILYFNVTNPNPLFKPKLIVQQSLHNNPLEDTFVGVWDKLLELYTITFTLRQNLFEGPISYILPIRDTGTMSHYLYDSTYILSSRLISMFGKSAELHAISNYADQLPPLIVNVVRYPISGVHTVDPDVENVFGWDLTIEDLVNGLDWGYVNVTSNLDPVPYRYEINGISPMSGDKYRGTYSIRTTLFLQSMTQTFTFSAYLVDLAGHVSQKNGLLSMDPLIRIPSSTPLDIQVIYPANGDTLPPVITIFDKVLSLDVGQADRTLTFDIEIEDYGVGVMEKNTPTIYISSLYTTLLACPTTLVQCQTMVMNGIAVPFECKFTGSIQVPYGFGQSGVNFSVSVYDTSPDSDTDIDVLCRHRSKGLSTGQLADSRFNQPLERGMLPDTIENLIFGTLYNQQFSPGCLPSSLTKLILGSHYNKPFSIGVLPGDRFDQPLVASGFPSSLKYLDLGSTFNQVLKIGDLPKGLLRLIFGRCFNKPILEVGVIPNTLTHLDLGIGFNCQLLPNILPSSLTHLKFGSRFNNGFKSLHQQSFPPNLTHLTFGLDFRQNLVSCLPGGLKHLKFINLPAGMLVPGVIPAHLTHLTIEKCDAQLIKPEQLFPSSLTKCTFSTDALQSTMDYPIIAKLLSSRITVEIRLPYQSSMFAKLIQVDDRSILCLQKDKLVYMSPNTANDNGFLRSLLDKPSYYYNPYSSINFSNNYSYYYGQ
eukprot:gene17448-20814_t